MLLGGTINASWRTNVARIKQRAVLRESNDCLLRAAVRTADEKLHVIECVLRSAVLDRVCATVPCLPANGVYDVSAVLRRNNDVLFFDSGRAGDFVSAEVAALLDRVPQGEDGASDECAAHSVEGGRGIVYIFTNSAMPNVVKIGRTTESVSRRVSELCTTGVPTPFEVFYAAFVEDPVRVEKLLHEHFRDKRINERREFFGVGPREVHQVLAQFAIGDATFT